MNKMNLFALLAITLAALCPLSPANAAEPAKEYAFDPAHCSITFQVRHIFVNVPGRFSDFGGAVRFDPNNLAGSSFDIKVKAASLDTFVDKRNEHLRTADFFDVAKFPEISFKSKAIERKSETQYLIKGTMTLKGVSRDIELPVTYFGVKPNPMDPTKNVAGFAATLDVFMPDYSFCDPKWAAMGVLGQHALLDINFEMLSDK
jgi:polyisoprenoid-binding protein YceI